MRKEEFFEVLGELDDDIVKGAKTSMKENTNCKDRKYGWLKWGAVAACLCLVIGGVFIYLNQSNVKPGAGGGPEPIGGFPDGVDPIIASLAVFPETEDIVNVENATIESITEADAYEVDTLGRYLPASLPGNYHFGNASLYETTMKDGTKYYMLRVTYTTGTQTTSQGEDVAPDPNSEGNSFAVLIMNYKPKTKNQIYKPSDITESKLNEIGGTTFHISYEDIFVGISPLSATPDDIIAVVNSIK